MALFDTTFAPYVPFGSRTLTSGATGTDVAVLQAVYNLMVDTMNPPQGPMGSPIPLTGTYDAATAEAVQNIQSYFGIAVDGIADPDTYFLFGQGVGAHTTYGGPVYGSRQLSVASTGGDVTILQNRLNVFRYATVAENREIYSRHPLVTQRRCRSYGEVSRRLPVSSGTACLATGLTFPPRAFYVSGPLPATVAARAARLHAAFSSRSRMRPQPSHPNVRAQRGRMSFTAPQREHRLLLG
jgi:hypothetical protein